MDLKIYVGMEDEGLPAQQGLGDAVLLPTNMRTWLLDEGASAIDRVAKAVASKRILSAVVRSGPLPSDMPWLAVEFHGRIVVEPALADSLRMLLPGWTGEIIKQFGLVLSPAPNQKLSAEKRRSAEQVVAPLPSWWEVDLADARRNPVDWFGEFGRDDVGGWVTLMSAAEQLPGGRAAVGNFAALGLALNREPDSLFAAHEAKLVQVAAIGLRREQAIAGDFRGLGRPGETFDLSALAGSPADYCVAIRIEAPVDPTVIIGSGTVFEQLGPGSTQNLAIATPWHDTIDAGQIVTTVLPAWCMNQNLSPPSGELVRLTPLAFTGASTDQGAVWADIGRRRGNRASP